MQKQAGSKLRETKEALIIEKAIELLSFAKSLGVTKSELQGIITDLLEGE